MKLLQGLLSQRIVGLLVLVVLVLAIYFVGHLSGVDWLWLHVAAGAIVLLAVLALVVQKLMAQKAAGALESALKSQSASQLGGTRPDQRADLEALKQQFDESLQLLRSSKMGRGALHSIPWFLLIGPPGSGKSTLLRQSGLSFPYMTKGRSAIRGLGGTKNCDWWFADRGILLDTAGRYTTEAEDRDEWMSFLRMLQKGRKRRPVNGAIVAIGLSELLESTDAEVQAHTENIRDRIDELTRELQTVFPVYVVFTKCDRLRGFVETFDTLNKEQRRQVWGFTFPFARGKDFVVADHFAEEFDALYRSLCVRRVDLMASDHFKKRKAQLYAFPLQFLRVKERLQAFLGQLQQDNPYQEVSPIRGVYFTSGTQEGTTIDRILKVLRPAELEHDVPEDSRRCYFVDDLFNKVVFADSELAAPSAKSAKREKLARLGAAVGLLAGLAATAWFAYGKWSGFRADCASIQATILGGTEKADAARMRASLDAQARTLDGKNHHLERGGVLGKLEANYRRSLQVYANDRVGEHVAAKAREALAELPAESAPPPTTPAEKQQRFQLAAAANERLERIAAGISAFRARRAEDHTAAEALWQAAVDDTAAGRRHFETLFAAKDLELSIPGATEALKNARERLVAALGREQVADLREANDLSLDKLFPTAWQDLESGTTRFGDNTAVVARSWNPKVLALEVKAPLFALSSTKSTALHLERLFAELDADVKKAKERVGTASGLPLASLPGSGWASRVDEQRAEFEKRIGLAVDAGWSTLLGNLTALVKAGDELPGKEDTEGVLRQALLPELVAAWRTTQAVLARRGPLAEEQKKDLVALLPALKEKQQVTPGDWAKRPGKPKPEAPLAQSLERARTATAWHLAELERIKVVDWGVPQLRNQLLELEVALAEAIVRREWAACRADVVSFATQQVFPLWDKVEHGFPFAPDDPDEADAAELAPALKAMAELAATVRQFEPAEQFAPHPEFLADAQAAEELCRILYADKQPKAAPNLEVTLEVGKEGESIGKVQLTSEKRRVVDGQKVDWPLQETESLSLSIELVENQASTLSLKDLIDVRRQQVPPNLLNDTRLVPGFWSLKRLFAMGSVKKAGDQEWISTLQLQGRKDLVLLVVKSRRPEVANVFAPDWPGDRYTLSRRIWLGQ